MKKFRTFFAFAVCISAFAFAQGQTKTAPSKTIKAQRDVPAATLTGKTTPTPTRVAPATSRKAVARRTEAISAPRARKQE